MIDIIKILICVIYFVKIVKCCDCSLEDMIKDTASKSKNNNMEKRQMHNEEDVYSETIIESETTEGFTRTRDQTLRPLARKVVFRGNINTKNTVTTEESKDNDDDECLYFQDMPAFNLDKMLDVWKIAYYRATDKLACFKLHIKKTTIENRKDFHDSYGDFNGSINWNNCLFEVVSSALVTGNPGQRHFLEASIKNMGVFKNVIVTKNETGDLVSLLEQSPDQWLVVNNLLVMRDCDNGDVVVFSRLPMEPALRDIEDALGVFGEGPGNGTFACETLRDPKSQTLS